MIRNLFLPMVCRLAMPAMILAIALMVWGCRTTRTLPEPEPQPVVTESGLQYLVTRKGNAVVPAEGDIVRVHYTGKLEDGTIIDSSYERQEPIHFRIGSGQVIRGLEEGILRLSQGGKATLVIPPDLAYGSRSVGPVPANATLVFEVELLEVSRPGLAPAAKNLTRQSLESGLEYVVLEKGNGRRLEPGMRVTVHYTGYLEDETIFDSSLERGRPIQFILGQGMVIAGWDEGLGQLQVGDKARLFVPSHLAYGPGGRGPIPPNADLIFDVEVLDAFAFEPPRPFDVTGLDTLFTETGLQYIIVQQGDGEFPQPGQVLRVHYSGYLMDGTLFDSSVQRGEPFRFVLGQGQVIRGWDEGFSLLSRGARARLILPPHLGYGDRDMGAIPPGSSLIFDVELIDF